MKRLLYSVLSLGKCGFYLIFVASCIFLGAVFIGGFIGLVIAYVQHYNVID